MSEPLDIIEEFTDLILSCDTECWCCGRGPAESVYVWPDGNAATFVCRNCPSPMETTVPWKRRPKAVPHFGPPSMPLKRKRTSKRRK